MVDLTKNNIKPDGSVTPLEKDMTLSERQEKVESCVAQLNKIGVPRESGFAIVNNLLSEAKKPSEFDAFIKKFVEGKSSSFMGVTSKDGEKKHNHSFVVIAINWGEELIGVTTGTTGGSTHLHTIKLDIDYKIIAIEANTNMSDGSPETANDSATNANDFHNHTFKISVDDIRAEVPTITTRRYFNEDGKLVEGDIKKALSSVNVKIVSEDMKYRFNNIREAEVLLNRVANMEIKPEGYNGTLIELQEKVFKQVFDEYPNLKATNNNAVSEISMNFFNKGGDFIFAANSADVIDNKGHFPIGSKDIAKNALARVAQFNENPSWYQGSLTAMQQKVYREVKKKYSDMSAKSLNEHYALRFKENQDVHFLFLGTQNLKAAQHDAGIYFKECPTARIDLVKFTYGDNSEVKFSEIGNICLYDVSNKIFRSCSNEIKLSEASTDGTIPIEILREGDFIHEAYGDLGITTEKLDTIIKNFNDDVLDREVAFDLNHLSELPAVAWVKKLSMVNKNIKGASRMVLLAHSKLTKRGREAIESEDFKYFSAEYSDNFRDKESGKNYGTVLKGGGLTNRPWMPGLAPVTLSEISDGIGIMSMIERSN